MAIKILQYVFVVAFLGGMFLGLCFFDYFLITFIITPIVRLFWPRFGELSVPQTVETKSAEREVKRVAIDFVFQERIRRMNEVKRQMNEMLEAKFASIGRTGSYVGTAADEIDFENSTLHSPPRPSRQPPSKDDREIADRAEFTLMHVDDGRVLCARLSERGGLRTAFASLPLSRSIRLDLESAKRLTTVIPNSTLYPANVYARMLLKKEKASAQTA